MRFTPLPSTSPRRVGALARDFQRSPGSVAQAGVRLGRATLDPGPWTPELPEEARPGYRKWPPHLITRPTQPCLIASAAPGICHNWIHVSGMEELNNQIAVCLYLFVY